MVSSTCVVSLVLAAIAQVHGISLKQDPSPTPRVLSFNEKNHIPGGDYHPVIPKPRSAIIKPHKVHEKVEKDPIIAVIGNKNYNVCWEGRKSEMGQPNFAMWTTNKAGKIVRGTCASYFGIDHKLPVMNIEAARTADVPFCKNMTGVLIDEIHMPTVLECFRNQAEAKDFARAAVEDNPTLRDQ